jgi:SAM-dependent methyltransferase
MVTDWYESNATSVVPQYEAIDAATLHAWLRDLLPNAPAVILDIGAGSGRDAAWLASLGYEVVAAEPSAAMRTEAVRLHPSPRIRWTDDALPDLYDAVRSGLSFDAVLVSAVWQHVHPSQRARAFRKMASVLSLSLHVP